MGENNVGMETISLRLSISGVVLDAVPMAMTLALLCINSINLIRYNKKKEQETKPKPRKMGRDFIAWAIASGWSHGSLYADTERASREHKADIETEIQGIFDVYDQIRGPALDHGIDAPDLAFLYAESKNKPKAVPPGPVMKKTIQTLEDFVGLVDDLSSKKSIFRVWGLLEQWRLAVTQENLNKHARKMENHIQTLVGMLPLKYRIEDEMLLRKNRATEIAQLWKKNPADISDELEWAMIQEDIDRVLDLTQVELNMKVKKMHDNIGEKIDLITLGNRGYDFGHGRHVRTVSWNDAKGNTHKVKALAEVRDAKKLGKNDELGKELRRLCIQLSLNEGKRHSELRMLQCIGYQVDTQAASTSVSSSGTNTTSIPPHILVFAWPAGQGDEVHNLYGLLQTPFQYKPTAKERFYLAQQLTRGLSRLHMYGWLHKAIRSTNIIFFHEDDTAYSIARPYIAGFESIRSLERKDLTHSSERKKSDLNDRYRHPNCQGGFIPPIAGEDQDDREGYLLEYDLYSLGIVLCEIGFWKRVDSPDFLSFPGRFQPATFRRALKQKLEKWDSNSSPGLGDDEPFQNEQYRTAVINCLKGGIQNDFCLAIEEVVAPLERACEGLSLNTM